MSPVAGLKFLQLLTPITAQRLVAGDALAEQQALDAIDVTGAGRLRVRLDRVVRRYVMLDRPTTCFHRCKPARSRRSRGTRWSRRLARPDEDLYPAWNNRQTCPSAPSLIRQALASCPEICTASNLVPR